MDMKNAIGKIAVWVAAVCCLALACAAEPAQETPAPAAAVMQAGSQIQAPEAHVYPDSAAMAQARAKAYPDPQEGFLPVFFRCRTDKPAVAFTIDDCNQPDNLRAIIQLFQQYGGAATIFPIGQNVDALAGTLKAAWQDGFEIENHTWSHSGLYHETDQAMCREIWDQNRAVSEALGLEYQMHFLRPRGGDNRYDQRTHAYLRQLGYYGVAYWSQVGLSQSAAEMAEGVKSGDILLFHTTDADVAQLMELVPLLDEAGYRFVTLNELYGLPDNETWPLGQRREAEKLAPYRRFDQTYRKNDYLRDVYLIQDRLHALGFLSGHYNGYYGEKTADAVRAFQQSQGLAADGVCGKNTWDALFGG